MIGVRCGWRGAQLSFLPVVESIAIGIDIKGGHSPKLARPSRSAGGANDHAKGSTSAGVVAWHSGPSREVGRGLDAIMLSLLPGPAEHEIAGGIALSRSDKATGYRSGIGAGDGLGAVGGTVAIGIGIGSAGGGIPRGPDIGDAVAIAVDRGPEGQRKRGGDDQDWTK